MSFLIKNGGSIDELLKRECSKKPDGKPCTPDPFVTTHSAGAKKLLPEDPVELIPQQSQSQSQLRSRSASSSSPRPAAAATVVTPSASLSASSSALPPLSSSQQPPSSAGTANTSNTGNTGVNIGGSSGCGGGGSAAAAGAHASHSPSYPSSPSPLPLPSSSQSPSSQSPSSSSTSTPSSLKPSSLSSSSSALLTPLQSAVDCHTQTVPSSVLAACDPTAQTISSLLAPPPLQQQQQQSSLPPPIQQLATSGGGGGGEGAKISKDLLNLPVKVKSEKKEGDKLSEKDKMVIQNAIQEEVHNNQMDEKELINILNKKLAPSTAPVNLPTSPATTTTTVATVAVTTTQQQQQLLSSTQVKPVTNT